MSARPELVYVGDPLCSWCWGFSPSLAKLREDYPDAFDYRLIVGGLRAGSQAQKLDDGLRGYLATAWREVEKRTGQPFDHDFLARAEFVYDTEPACRAVVTARELAPDRVFDYYDRLQDAFYRRGNDPTATETFLDVADDLSLPRAVFRNVFEKDDTLHETRNDFAAARALGVFGFPSVLVRHAGRLENVSRGWLPPELLTESLAEWLPKKTA